MPSTEYLDAILEQVKQHLPEWLYAELHRQALPVAGGRARWREPEEPSALEKMALREMRPARLREADDEEVRLAWLRLNQWFAAAKRRGDAVEPIVNAAAWVLEEFRRRGFDYDEEGELAQEVARLRKSAEAGGMAPGLAQLLAELPEEVLLVKDFVAVVGSAAEGKPDYQDVDVLIRANRDESGDYFLLQADGVWLPLRKAFDPRKEGTVHFLDAPQGPHATYLPCYSLVLRREEPQPVVLKEEAGEVAKAERPRVEPGKRFTVEKPAMAGVTEWFEVDELWGWVKKKLEQGAVLGGEVKYDGFRCVVGWDGRRAYVWFEDAQEDRSDQLPEFAQAFKAAKLPSVVLDGELLAYRGGKLVPRTQLAELLTRRGEELVPHYCVFDCLYYDGVDISQHTLKERRATLEEVLAKLNSPLFELSELRPINDRATLAAVGRWAASQPGSEGLIVKDLTRPYVFGASDDWAKLKTVVELKVRVLDVERTGAGYVYRCGLRAAGPYVNVTEGDDGKIYVDLGRTFATKEKLADVGDTLNVRVEELIILQSPSGPRLAWGKPRVVGPDRSRGPYTAVQAVDIAKRGGVLKREVTKGLVPGVGPIEAPVAFVGASASDIDAIRGEPFTGPAGAVLRDLYLEPLGLQRSQAYLLTAVPTVLAHGRKLREPSEGEIELWRDWLMKELDRVGPGAVIALGRKAKLALGDRADLTLPHPEAVRRHGDSGEVGRKLRRLARERLRKEITDEEGTTGERAMAEWARSWFKMAPASGRGRFVYQHHWRGLSEEEAKLDEEALFQTNHSVHGDLRFEANDDELWGFTVFLGSAKEAQEERLGRDALQGQFKLAQPKTWLEVGVRRPYVAPPGSAGATSRSYAKFFAVDHGTYEVGVWREHMLEVFLHGAKLKGRFLFQYAPVAQGRRVWLITRPKDQTPYAEKHELSDVARELREKGQRWLIWGKPGERPRLIDVTQEVEKAEAEEAPLRQCQILKTDEEKRLVYGIVLEPDVVDAQGDVAPAEEIEEAAHYYLVHSRMLGVWHGRPAPAEVVESYIAPVDFELGDQPVKAGSWVLVTRVPDDELWARIKAGEFQAYSVGGYAVREEMEVSDDAQAT